MEDKREGIDAWIVKYALTEGIVKVRAEVCADINPEMIKPVAGQAFMHSCFHGKGREWCASAEDAVKVAGKMRDRKIASLKKQIQKLEGMTWKA